MVKKNVTIQSFKTVNFRCTIKNMHTRLKLSNQLMGYGISPLIQYSKKPTQFMFTIYCVKY